MAAVPARARATERALTDAHWNSAGIEAAAAALAADFQPLTDLRASAAYRLQSAANLLRRFFLEHGGTTRALRTADALAAST
jgi:xanthine dehydrogenase small subunit